MRRFHGGSGGAWAGSELAVRVFPAGFRRSVASNYANTGVSLVLALVVTPILVHGLGKAAYGTWVLVNSSVFYFNLFEFGFSRATVRYVAAAKAVGDFDRIRRIIATSFATMSIPGTLLFLAAPLFGLLVPYLFDIPASLRTAAIIVAIISVCDLAVSIPADTFGAGIVGFSRYDLLNLSTTLTMLGQSIAWIVVLSLGYGLVGVGVATVTLSLASQVVRFVMLRRLVRAPLLRPRDVDRRLVKPLASMSSWIAVTDFTEMITNRIDPIVVGIVVGVPQAGVYAVGSKLGSLSGRLATPLSSVLFPHASEVAAAGESELLRETFLAGARAALAVSTPITVVLAVLAGPLLDAWVGNGFEAATTVVVCIACAGLVSTVSSTGIEIVRGIGKVRRPAHFNLVEAALNFGLSVGLGLAIGLQGVAVGTLIACLVVQVGLLLPYMCREIGIPVRTVAAEAFRSHALPSAVTLAVGFAVVEPRVHGLFEVLAGGALLGTLYMLVALRTALRPAERRRVVALLLRRQGRGPSAVNP